MPMYRKKPVVIEAVPYDGTNHAEIAKFTGLSLASTDETVGMPITIQTLEGDHLAQPGDLIIKGVKGEFYPCKPDFFAATYDPASFKPKTSLDFGEALAALKAGAKVARAGWNGKGMWIALTPGSAFEARHAKCGHAAAKRADEINDPAGEIELLPHIDMRAADGCMVVGWLASQTDMLADDWQIVP